jgi:hypothetical protein
MNAANCGANIKDNPMYERKVVNGLALVGALIVILGVTVAASTALASEAGPSDTTLISEIVSNEKG